MTLTLPRDVKKPYIWFDINQSYFSIYKVEGVNPEDPDDNVIYFEVKATYLLTALNSLKKAANFVEIKLSKDEFPYFTVNIRIAGTDKQKNISISNKVPVIIIPRLEWDDFALPYPSPDDYDVEAKCPRLSIFKRYVDSFKYCRNVRFLLRNDETMTIEAIGEAIRNFTIFRDIKVNNYSSTDSYNGPTVSVLIELKKITSWLHSLSFPSQISLMCFLQEKRQFKLFFRIRDDILAHLVIAAEFEDNDDSDVEASE